MDIEACFNIPCYTLFLPMRWLTCMLNLLPFWARGHILEPLGDPPVRRFAQPWSKAPPRLADSSEPPSHCTMQRRSEKGNNRDLSCSRDDLRHIKFTRTWQHNETILSLGFLTFFIINNYPLLLGRGDERLITNGWVYLASSICHLLVWSWATRSTSWSPLTELKWIQNIILFLMQQTGRKVLSRKRDTRLW